MTPRASSTSRPSSKETLSDKLRHGKEPRRHTRKRLSATSETSHSTAASSGALPLNAVVATPISPQQPFDKKKVIASSSSSPRDDMESNSNNKTKSHSRRRRHSAGRESKADKVNHVSQSRRESVGSDSSWNNFTDVSWDEESPRATGRSLRSPPSENRHHKESKRSTTKSAGRGQEDGSMSANSSSRRSSSTGRHRRISTASSTRRTSTSSSVVSPKSTRKRISISSATKSSRRSSTASKSKSKSRHRRSDENEQSLTSFMQKEDSNRPKESEDALETKSAFTSISMSRNRTKYKHDDWAMSASYHGRDSVGSRNTRKFRDMMAAKAASLNSEAEHEAELFEATTKTFHRSHSADAQKHGEEDSKSSFEQSSLDFVDSSGGMHQHQGFAGLPVLQEESKKSKKLSKMKKSARKSNKKKSGVSTQELSDFLDKCNSKKEEKDARGKSFLSSPISGDRSCVSMPALQSSSRGKNRKSPKVSMAKLQHSYRGTFETTVAPPDDSTAESSVEKSGEKGRRRSRSNHKSRSRRQKRSNSRNRDHSDLHVPSPNEPQRRSQSVEATFRKQDAKARPRSLSRTRKNSRHSNGSYPSLLEMQDNSTKPDETDKGAKRPKGLQKLFSFRDLKRDGAAAMSSGASLEFRRDDTTSSWAVSKPQLDQEESHDGSVSVSLPSMTPHSPVPSDFGDTSQSEDERRASLGSRQNRRWSTISEVDLSEDDCGVFEDDSIDQQSDDSKRKRHSSSLGHASSSQQPASILKNREKQIPVQAGGDAGIESDAEPDDVTDARTEEDVFSRYTWANEAPTTDQETEQTREERLRLKESIRNSVLYSAFEAIIDIM